MRTAAACRSSTANFPVRTSASSCRSTRTPATNLTRRVRRRNTRMPHDLRARCALAGALPVLGVLLLAGCGAAADLLNRGATRNAEPQPVVDRAAASSTVITSYLETLQRLVAAPAAEQAEIVTGAQHDYELAPTPSHQLRYALILATPGHAGTDQLKAQRMLREITASPAALLPAERALASLEMQKVDLQVSLAAENRRL